MYGDQSEEFVCRCRGLKGQFIKTCEYLGVEPLGQLIFLFANGF